MYIKAITMLPQKHSRISPKRGKLTNDLLYFCEKYLNTTANMNETKH